MEKKNEYVTIIELVKENYIKVVYPKKFPRKREFL